MIMVSKNSVLKAKEEKHRLRKKPSKKNNNWKINKLSKLFLGTAKLSLPIIKSYQWKILVV